MGSGNQTLGDVALLTHVVTDEGAVVGRLLLVDPGSLGATELASVGAVRPDVAPGGTDHAGVAVERIRSPAGDVQRWTHDGHVGAG